MMLDDTHDPDRTSWVDGAGPGSDFPVQNLPLGIFSEAKGLRRPGVAIGDYILDLGAAADLLDEQWIDDLSQPILNAWLSRGHEAHRALRTRLSEILMDQLYFSRTKDFVDNRRMVRKVFFVIPVFFLHMRLHIFELDNVARLETVCF